MLAPLLSPALKRAGVRHAFFTREGGVSEGVYAGLNGGIGSADNPDHVRENRARMAAYLGVAPEKLLSLYQIHSANALLVDENWPLSARPQADAMVSAAPGFALGVGAADCGPILFADAEAGVVGAAHSGWKGAIGGVLEATIERMIEAGARRERIIAALGPMLSQENYEVGPEFEAQFLAEADANARFFRPGAKAGHPHFDLPGYIVHRLAGAGIAEIDNLGLCTYADEARFYSYRRKTHRGEADYGRLIAAIVL
ncbi:MAG: peptidoglycan editing factor PgeF [Proteobacteria bacterium]|nr:peptidoglycan editing factor PgeF [Pseudomonadota bacterium]